MSQRFQVPTAPVAPFPAPASSTSGISQTVPGAYVPDRFKTNAEWVEEAQAQADRAAQAVVKQATIDRLHAVHVQVLDHLYGDLEVPLELLEEYGTLAGV